jgi:ABC-type spermidine/putrescine transport system permease subunit I
LALAATLGLPLLTLLLLFVAPIAITAAYSLWTVDDNYQLVTTPSLAQYEKLATTPLYRDTLVGSLWVALLTTVVCTLLAVPLALAIGRLVPARWRALLIVALILPGWISILIRTYSMNLVIGENGLLNSVLVRLGLINEPLAILFTPTAVVIGLVYIYLPYTLVPIYAAVERLDPALLEAAENLGAGPWPRFRRVILPLIMPGVIAGCIITFIPALGEYLVPNLLGGLAGLMYGNLIATAFQSFDWPLGAALSVVLLALVLALLYTLSRFGQLSRVLVGS